MKTIKGKDVKIFTDNIDKKAYDQIKNLANHEAYKDSKIRIMPDVHAGMGCTIGTTMVITDKITPNLVGVDIGCGMLTCRIDKGDIDFEKLDKVIQENIPSGFNIHKEQELWVGIIHQLKCKDHVDLERADLSVGTLGGGNHFIEVGESDTTGIKYLIIHSGSRRLGQEVADYYQKLAIDKLEDKSEEVKEIIDRLKSEGRDKDIQTELNKIKKPSTFDKQLAYLEGQDMQDYLYDMKLVQEYAVINRAVMAAKIFIKMEWYSDEGSNFSTIHNYIDTDNMILRKGAISAERGERILIPINMKDGSLVCRGLGNDDWNRSAPHGAGRLMSRSQAKDQIDLDEFKESMEGIHSTSVGQSTLDEAPQAYKGMDEIIENLKGTAYVEEILKPLYNFKAH